MGDNQQLLNLLSLPNVLLDPSKQKQAITQLCQLINTDSDEPCIVQPSIKLLSSHQPLTRIAVMMLVQRHVGRNPDIMPQATNALLKCAVDPNPAVRRAAVSTLACLPDSADITQPVVAAALRDPHPSVQRAAVVACRVFPRTNPDCHMDHVDELYRLIRSDDPLLVHACLMTLDVILAAEGGVVISRAMVKHLCSRSRSLPDTVLVDVLHLLTRYQPGSDEERLAIMNRLDWLLASTQPHLIEVSLQLFFHLCSGQLAHLRPDAVARAAGALCSPADSAPEVRWAVLEMVRRLGPEHHPAFYPHYRYFVPRPADGAAISLRLVELLWRLAGPDSAPAVARELTACLHSERLQAAAVRSLLRLGRRRPQLAAAVIEPLSRLARGGGGGGADRVAAALSAADLAPLPAAARRRLLSSLLAADVASLSPPVLCRLLPLLGRWGGALPAVPARLRQLARAAGLDAAARRALLEAVARVFVQRPAELQLTLGWLLERAAAEGGEAAAVAARLYAALETTGGGALLDGSEAEGGAVEREGDGAESSEQGFLSVPVTPT